jgi:hypothetical protein
MVIMEESWSIHWRVNSTGGYHFEIELKIKFTNQVCIHKTTVLHGYFKPYLKKSINGVTCMYFKITYSIRTEKGI